MRYRSNFGIIQPRRSGGAFPWRMPMRVVSWRQMKTLLSCLRLIAYVFAAPVVFAVLSAMLVKCLTEHPVVTVLAFLALVTAGFFLGGAFPSRSKQLTTLP